jgi:hypothetical protein
MLKCFYSRVLRNIYGPKKGEGSEIFRKIKKKREDNIKVDLKKIGCEYGWC